MFARLLLLLARLRIWLQVRLGLWRGRWRRRQVSVPGARLFSHPLAGSAWSYGLYCPSGLRDDTPAPLVVLLHGCRQRALGFALASGFVRAADAQRFRLLCPQQRRRANLWHCWNWFTPAAQRGAGELDVVRAMLDDATTHAQVAVSTVGVVGLSAGGALATLLAFHAADRVAAVVAVASPPLLGRMNIQDPRDVMKRGLAVPPVLALIGQAAIAPLMVVQGRADAVVAPVCGEQLVQQACRALERSGATLHTLQPESEPGAQLIDHRTGDTLVLREVWIDALGHAWSGAIGGHPYVESAGDPLTARALRFLRDTGVLRSGRRDV